MSTRKYDLYGLYLDDVKFFATVEVSCDKELTAIAQWLLKRTTMRAVYVYDAETLHSPDEAGYVRPITVYIYDVETAKLILQQHASWVG